MEVQIGHARQDERGKARGGQAGDQKGNEVRVENFYVRKGGWGVYLEPLDAAMGARAAENMRAICENDNIGYDQDQRQTARKAVQEAGSIAAAGPSEVDCSSAVDLAYERAGLPITLGSTHNLERRYLATGKFKAYKDAAHLTSAAYARRGGMYLTAGAHVCMVLTDGPQAGQSSMPADIAAEADDIRPPYVLVLGGRVRVRSGPGTNHKKLFSATKGMKLRYGETDADTNWYIVETRMGDGYISGDPELTRLIT